MLMPQEFFRTPLIPYNATNKQILLIRTPVNHFLNITALPAGEAWEPERLTCSMPRIGDAEVEGGRQPTPRRQIGVVISGARYEP